MQALFGTRTAADFNLVAQCVILAGLYIGWAMARRKRFDLHADIQTAMVLLNVPLIAFMMLLGFTDYVIVGGHTTEPGDRLMIAHGAIGLGVEFIALYLILQMRTKLVPRRFRIGNIKLAMRATLALWTVVFVLGVGIYVAGYVLPSASAGASGQTHGRAAHDPRAAPEPVCYVC